MVLSSSVFFLQDLLTGKVLLDARQPLSFSYYYLQVNGRNLFKYLISNRKLKTWQDEQLLPFLPPYVHYTASSNM
jgi:hypothetical protein